MRRKTGFQIKKTNYWKNYKYTDRSKGIYKQFLLLK